MPSRSRLVTRARLGGAAFALSTLAATSAWAQRPSVDGRTWRPSTDPNASLVIEPAVTPGPGVLSVGGWAHYSLRPVTLRTPGTGNAALRPVEHLLGLDATVNLGVGERFAIGAAVPVVLYQDGSSGMPTSVSQVGRVPSSGIGDVGISFKGSLVRNESGGFGLAALGWVSLPTGERAGFMGEGALTTSARILAEYTLIVATAQASVGYKLRTEHRTWPAPEAGGYRFGDELPWSVGFAMRPGILGVDPGNRQRWELAAHGWLPAGPVGPFGAGDPGSAALSPVLLAVSDRIELGRYRDTFLTIGGEIGLNQAAFVPVFRGIVSIGWAPREHDMDRDGVKDDVDGCPEIPEDKDGFEDGDGCPEIDDDDDGILDAEDACPREAGVESSDPKKNGCPAPDADGDGIADAEDACPKEPGSSSGDPRLNGCPASDRDGDGIPDAVDRCPDQAEDKDGFQDEDGCPDPDNDGDGVSDAEDACKDVAGEPSTDPAKNGCPNLDRDGDTFANDVDRCPDTAEVFNGVDDDDGCPDEGGKALVVFDEKARTLRGTKLAYVGEGATLDVAPASVATLRAIALELNRRPGWSIAVGVRPDAGDEVSRARLDALGKSLAVVRIVASFTRRDGAVETVGWDAVKTKPGAESGVAFLVYPPAKPTTTTPGAPRP